MVKNAPNLNIAFTVTEPTAYTSGLDTVQYYALVDVVPACNAQLGGLSSTLMHEILASSHRETAEKRTETLVENAPNLNIAFTVTEPTAYTSGLDPVQYYDLVDVVPACNAQLGGLSSTMMHGA